MTFGETVGAIGERKLIRRLAPWLAMGSAGPGSLGVGDDCASLSSLQASHLILTTDLLIEDTHFVRTPQTDWSGVGRKAAGANVSDLASMGAMPAALLVSIALPADFLVQHVLDLYAGIHALASQYGCPIIGGDTTSGKKVSISITAVGWKDTSSASCLRTDARPGDIVYVTDTLGASRAAVELILHPALLPPADDSLARRIISRHHSPVPRVDVGLCLSKILPRVAVIDISDSLHNEAALLAEASEVEIQLDLHAIPVDPDAAEYCNKTGKDPFSFAIFSGEEYELLFTAPLSIENLRDKFFAAGVQVAVTQVGTVNPGSGVKLLKGGHPVDPKDETFTHFR